MRELPLAQITVCGEVEHISSDKLFFNIANNEHTYTCYWGTRLPSQKGDAVTVTGILRLAYDSRNKTIDLEIIVSSVRAYVEISNNPLLSDDTIYGQQKE